MEDPEAAFKSFRETLVRVENKRKQMESIEERR